MRVETRFYAELNDLLPRDRRGQAFTVEVAPGTTVKDLAESLGVPHTEIDVILVNSEPVGLAHRIRDGDRVSVYPMFEAFDVTSHAPFRPSPLRTPRFVLDVHLGKLARGLRLLGFDTRWHNHASDEDLVRASLREHRVLLTRDRGLLKRSAVTHGYLVRETAWRAQVQEVLRRFDLFDAVEPFRRCLECNGQLEEVAKADVDDQLSPRTRRDYDEFHRCLGCGRVYWRGSHFDRLRTVVDELRRGGPGASGRLLS
ncbi:MAG: Mut7-C ubiquitin/RNAse domain-containing protein [Acidimicrobiaceae bacterium]|nr:Mut7-C ubiquitin/RNAse domain-containing protein [Acidimicrobiaceae bacterium]MBO0887272.1 Mut7-C ubiquitin/RNAse domain-containing protein [Acidimicrobiales bacterium]